MAYDFKKLKEELKNAEEWLKKEYMSLRTGIATPAVLDAVHVEAYGSRMPMNQLATVSIEDARVLRITPYDKSLSKDIEKAIIASNLGLSVNVDDKGMRIFFPELTGERRTMLVKTAKEKLENAKKNVRAAREETMKHIEAQEKEGGMSEDDKLRYRKEAQKFIDDANANLESSLEKKEKEINS
jgi:ribosome recycling factor